MPSFEDFYYGGQTTPATTTPASSFEDFYFKAKPIAPKKPSFLDKMSAAFPQLGMARGLLDVTKQTPEFERVSGIMPTEAIKKSGGVGPYLTQMFSGENLKATGENFVKGIKGLPAGMLKTGEELANVGPNLMASLTDLNAPGIPPPPANGEVSSAPTGTMERIRESFTPVKNMVTFIPDLVKDWIRDPATAMRERGMDTVLTALGGVLGKGIHKYAAEWKAGFLSDDGLAKAFSESAKEVGEAAKFNANQSMVHVGSSIEAPPTNIKVGPGGVAVPITEPASRSLAQSGLDAQAAGIAKTTVQGPIVTPRDLPSTVIGVEAVGPTTAVEAGLRAYAKRNPDAYNTALRVGGEIQVAGKRVRWDREANRWVDAEPQIKELWAGVKPGEQDRLRMAISGMISKGQGKSIPPELLNKYPDLKAMVGSAAPSAVPVVPNAVPKQGVQYYKPGAKAVATTVPEPSPTLPAVPELQQKIMSALQEAKPLRRQQEGIYRAERSKRLASAMRVGKEVPGEAGLYAQLNELSGPMGKVEFESIRSKISQEDINSLFAQIEHSPAVQNFEKIDAKKGLAKMLGEYGGRVPQPHELELLDSVFGQPFVDAVVAKTPLFVKARTAGLEIANVPRAIMASLDLSFGLRQGVMLAARHPTLFAKSFVKQFQWFKSERAFRDTIAEIKSRPTYPLMQESGLALTEIGKNMAAREEPFMGAAPVEKIPVLGSIVRGSNRAFAGFANKLRADVFDYLIDKAEKLGRNPHEDAKLATDIATVVNTASGRGRLGATLERAAPALNAGFFSPRLMASRLQSLNPVYYIKLDKFARAEALKTLLSFVGAGTTIVGLAKLAGADVGLDWRSADFGKIKIGKTRIDVWGGFSQYARLAGQWITGEVVSSTSGKKMTLGEGYKPLTRLDITQRFLEYKTAPVVSFALGLMKGQGQFGEKYNLTDELARRFVPMIISDAIDIYKEDPKALPLSALGVFGLGVQTYSRRPSTSSSSSKGW